MDGRNSREYAPALGVKVVAQSPVGVQKARQAKELLKAGQWPAARSVYQELVQEFPEDRDLRRHLVLSAFKWRDYREVVQQTLDLADLFLAEGDTASGLERYSEILRLPELVAGDQPAEVVAEVDSLVEPLKADIYFAIGDAYLTAGQPDLALQYLEASDRLQPQRWETYWGQAQAKLLKGEKREAVRLLLQSIQLAPQEAASAYELLGEVLLGDGRSVTDVRKYFVRASGIFESYECYHDALRICHRWLQLDPQDRDMADAAFRLATLLSDS